MKTIALLSNEHNWTYNLRRELVQGLLTAGYRVVLILPYGEKVELFKQMGCEIVNVENFERRGKNPFKETALISEYKRILKSVKPDLILTFTIKPNLYGGMAAAKLGIPQIANVTGFGSAMQKGLLRWITLTLYRIGLRKTSLVFFQNEQNRKEMQSKNIIRGKTDLLPGSGVNTEHHRFEAYPPERPETIFVTVGRVMKEKGIFELLTAAEKIKSKYPDTVFRLIGFYDDDCKEAVDAAVRKGTVQFLGFQDDVRPFVWDCNALIHPSYHEGLSNVLLEAASAGRPVIASDIPGCRETFEPGISGIPCKVQNADSLTDAIESFLQLPYEEKKNMGKNGRLLVEQKFSREIVVKKYLDAIERLLEEK